MHLLSAFARRLAGRTAVLCSVVSLAWAHPQGGAPTAATEPDLVLTGELGEHDHQTYRTVPFAVPEGTARITVRFAYTGREQRTTIDLGLIGPDGFRGRSGFNGWSGGNKRVFTVSAVDATPSYRPAPLLPGQWALLLGIPNLRPGMRSTFTAEVYLARSLAVAAEPAFLRPALKAEEGWYRGDFHAHTGHSDGWMRHADDTRIPAPVHVALEEAAAAGLDFLALTEHNTTSVGNALRELQPLYPNLLLLPGQELTTFHGHANAFGTLAPLDFRVGSPAVPSWDALLDQATAEGALVSVNHPVRPSGEACMGCGWTNPADLARVQAIEIVNGPDAGTAYSGIPFWHQQLNAGLRLTGIGGSDTHGWRETAASPTTAQVGRPTTVVQASALSVGALLDGVRRGRVFVDVKGTKDSALDLRAQTGSGGEAVMGGVLHLRAGERVRFAAQARAAGAARIVPIADGTADPSFLAGAADKAGPGDHHFEWQPPAGWHWVRVDVVDAAGGLLLVGNPIYLNVSGEKK